MRSYTFLILFLLCICSMSAIDELMFEAVDGANYCNVNDIFYSSQSGYLCATEKKLIIADQPQGPWYSCSHFLYYGSDSSYMPTEFDFKAITYGNGNYIYALSNEGYWFARKTSFFAYEDWVISNFCRLGYDMAAMGDSVYVMGSNAIYVSYEELMANGTAYKITTGEAYNPNAKIGEAPNGDLYFPYNNHIYIRRKSGGMDMSSLSLGGAVVVDFSFNNPDKIYAFTAASGVWATENEGESWEFVCYYPETMQVVAGEAAHNSDLYIATSSNIYGCRLSNGDWKDIELPLNSPVRGIKYVHDNIYVLTNGLIYANKYAEEWHGPVHTKDMEYVDFDLDEEGNKFEINQDYVYRQKAGSDDWEYLDIPELNKEARQTRKIKIISPGHLMALTKEGWLFSTDNGDSWQNHSMPTAGSYSFMAVDSNDACYWYSQTNKSVMYSTTDFGENWSEIQNFPDNLIFFGIGQRDILMGLTKDSLLYSTDSGASWITTARPDTAEGDEFQDIVWAPGKICVAFSNVYNHEYHVFISTDKAESWSQYDSFIFFNYILADPPPPLEVHLEQYDNSIILCNRYGLMTLGNGLQWTGNNYGMDKDGFYVSFPDIDIKYMPDGTLYFFSSNGIWKIDAHTISVDEGRPEDMQSSISASAVPNPVASVCRIVLDKPDGRNLLMTLYDPMGNKLMSSKINNGQSEIGINMSGYPAGAYYAIISGLGNTEYISILKK